MRFTAAFVLSLLRQRRWSTRFPSVGESRRFGKAAVSFASSKIIGVWPRRVRPSGCSVLGISAILRFSLRLSRLVLNQTLQTHSLVQRSVTLPPMLGLVALVPQSAERANPSVKRTRNGRPLQAYIPFSALRVLPLRAAYLER